MGGAATIPPSMSSQRPLEKSRGFPAASETRPPASWMMMAPAAWSQIFSRYVAGGNRMKMDASPRAMAPYLAWLSTRSGSLVTLRILATRPENSWFECLASTDSMKTASSDRRSSTEAARLGMPSDSGPTKVPRPLTAAKMQPTPAPPAPSTPSTAAEVPSRWVIGACGMLGHPITPRTGSPPSSRPRAMAYCRPATNPRVPSMGSSTQCLPSWPPSEPPASMAASTSASESGPRPSSPARAAFTSSVIRARRPRFSSPSRSALSSSATMLKPHRPASSRCSATEMTAWAP